ncbi:MAG: hypothetical protein ACE10E_03120 [Acidiferrobacterales bacterium]
MLASPDVCGLVASVLAVVERQTDAAARSGRRRDLGPLGGPRYLRGKERTLAVPAHRPAIVFVLGDGSGGDAAVPEAGLGAGPIAADARGAMTAPDAPMAVNFMWLSQRVPSSLSRFAPLRQGFCFGL